MPIESGANEKVARGDVVVLDPEKKPSSSSDASSGLSYLASPVLILALWETVAALNWIDVRFFPPPSVVFHTFVEEVKSGSWFIHVGATLARVGVGFIGGSLLGVTIGAIMGLIPAVRITIFPIIASIYPIPKIAIFPLVLLILGLGEASKLVTVAASCTFLLSINVMAGVLNIPRVYKDVGRTFAASRFDFIRTIAIPAALPVVFSGLRLALGTSFLVVVGIEFIGAQQGIGWLIWHSWELFSIKLMFVGLLTISFLGLILMLAIGWLEKLLVPWRY